MGQNAHDCSFAYNNETEKAQLLSDTVEIGCGTVPHLEIVGREIGQKVADIPKTWDAFNDFFRPVQDGLKKAGMRNVYGLGYQLTATGVDPINTFNSF